MSVEWGLVLVIAALVAAIIGGVTAQIGTGVTPMPATTTTPSGCLILTEPPRPC